MKTLLVLLLLPSLALATISNTAFVTYKDSIGNTYSGNSNAAIVTVIVAPNITLNKTVLPVTAKSGDTVTYTIAYTNSGGDAANVVVTDIVPVGVTLVVGSEGSGTASGATVTWTVGSVLAGASGSVSFQAKVN